MQVSSRQGKARQGKARLEHDGTDDDDLLPASPSSAEYIERKATGDAAADAAFCPFVLLLLPSLQVSSISLLDPGANVIAVSVADMFLGALVTCKLQRGLLVCVRPLLSAPMQSSRRFMAAALELSQQEDATVGSARQGTPPPEPFKFKFWLSHSKRICCSHSRVLFS
jgi:hypothetical protein